MNYLYINMPSCQLPLCKHRIHLNVILAEKRFRVTSIMELKFDLFHHVLHSRFENLSGLLLRKFKGGICCSGHLAITYGGELMYLQICS